MKDFILKFRASRYFLYALGAFVLTWMGFHFCLSWFDPDLGGYNSILSTEASLMVSILLEMQLHNDAKIQELMKEVRTLVKEEAADIEAIEENLSELTDEFKHGKATDFN